MKFDPKLDPKEIILFIVKEHSIVPHHSSDVGFQGNRIKEFGCEPKQHHHVIQTSYKIYRFTIQNYACLFIREFFRCAFDPIPRTKMKSRQQTMLCSNEKICSLSISKHLMKEIVDPIPNSQRYGNMSI